MRVLPAILMLVLVCVVLDVLAVVVASLSMTS